MASTLVLRTVTPAPQHLFAVELESDTGYRYWTKVAERDLSVFLAETPVGYGLSDVDCSVLCNHPEHSTDADHVRWNAEARKARKAERRANNYPGYSKNAL